MAIKLRCPHCNSTEVVRDATAEWSVEEQDWVLRATMDDMSCDECGIEFNEAVEEEV